eukprot:3091593-Rhodomonas_salina.1
MLQICWQSSSTRWSWAAQQWGYDAQILRVSYAMSDTDMGYATTGGKRAAGFTGRGREGDGEGGRGGGGGGRDATRRVRACEGGERGKKGTGKGDGWPRWWFEDDVV